MPEHRLDVLFYSPWIGTLLVPGSGPPPGGAETQVLLVARGLAARGLRVGIGVDDTGIALPDTVDGVHVLRQPRPAGGGPLRPLVRIVLALRFLLAADARTYVQRGAGSVTGLVAFAARLRRRRFVFSSANVTDFAWHRLERSRLNRAGYALGIRAADRLVVQTEEQRELCWRHLRRDGVVIRSVAEAAPARTAPGEAFVWIGRLEPYKDPWAYVDLAEAVPRARFRLLGVAVSPEAEALRRRLLTRAAELPNLEVLDARPRREVGAVIERAVAVVNTSRDYEGMPNVFLEGWARGVPALSLAHDPDALIERYELGGYAGGSTERFAALAARLWEQRDREQDLASRCRRYVVEHHAPDVVIDRWLEALDAGTSPETSDVGDGDGA
ncbi:MAG: hypothetical protein AVDCRST_MAG85-1247 [uncultured Solirubrobacteraceae bacterium]|uniref:Glycosyltransferase subfamily 4-like N-terminal domain-containing protein n=1 Tax=uncultured Solirubrobacteraceae bacterium TaxID=1162706 RepID=A0A6J4SGX4_9ACTN|nr:MAG: hypothetical protein AVDCRST_MAG85-1247 [uncultured Solirubrobacteraceae bacterium]